MDLSYLQRNNKRNARKIYIREKWIHSTSSRSIDKAIGYLSCTILQIIACKFQLNRGRGFSWKGVAKVRIRFSLRKADRVSASMEEKRVKYSMTQHMKHILLERNCWFRSKMRWNKNNLGSNKHRFTGNSHQQLLSFRKVAQSHLDFNNFVVILAT